MSSSKHEGRNQKLVIDYLESLLSDSQDSTIDVSQELVRQAKKEQLEEESITPKKVAVGTDVAAGPDVVEKIQAEAESDSQVPIDLERQVPTVLEVEVSADPAAAADAIEIDATTDSGVAAGSDVVEKIQAESETETESDRQVPTVLEVEVSADPAAAADAIEIDATTDSGVAAGADVVEKIQAETETEIEIETDRQVHTVLEVEVSADPAAAAVAIEIEAPTEAGIAAEQETRPDVDTGDINNLQAPDLEEAADALDEKLPINTLEMAVEDAVNGLPRSTGLLARNMPLAGENEASIAIDHSHLSPADPGTSVPEQPIPVVENIQSEAPMIHAYRDDKGADDQPELSVNCLIVLMYGLKLAIPFEHIEGHIRISNVTLSIDNERDWIIGDFTSLTMRTHIVDTAQIIFGNNYDPLKSNYNEMLVLQGKHWSIMFDKVIKTQNIKLSDVCENPSPQLRPWLTGTYMAEKCALVNVAAMVKLFEQQLNG